MEQLTVPDYGHDLQFGTFITPQAERPETAVALARISEQSDLDLATFQDHPYQNRFLDTWTLMTWVAAQTQHITVAPNVANLPLRPPTVLARAAASLDLLSHGRFELGLGAGAFWDAMEAMGIRRLSAGESRRALSEAIDIIRDTWNVHERGGIRREGEFYQVTGMTRGPAPAHDIGIWLGAYKPLMLRLTGHKADGWLPSMGYADLDQLREGNRVIDEAAVEAGRQPSDIRRMLNINGTFLSSNRGFLTGPPKQWAEQLAQLALEQGFSTFILGGDDASAIETFGKDVAPDVRERVASARGVPAPQRRQRDNATAISLASPADPLAIPSDDIDYEAIPASIRDNAIAPGDRAYDRARSTYMKDGHPGLVLMTESPEEVAAAITYARQQLVPLSIRSGGHGSNGLSTNDGGIVIDVARINRIDVLDETTRRVRVGAGATWGQVAEALGPHGWAMTSGDFPDVGVGGIATAGGIGLLARKYGLMIDNIVAADIVLADGRILRADEETNPDLLWGIRGAGANLGIVTHVEFTALPVGNIVYAMFALDATDMANTISRWGMYMESAPRELTSFLYLSPARRGQHQPVAQIVAVWANDDIPSATAALEPFLTWAPVLQQGAQVAPYAAVMAPQNAEHSGQQTLKARTGLLDHLNRETADAVAWLMQEGRVPWANFRMVGGAVNDLPAEATAYAHRTQNVCFTAYDLYPDRRNIDPAWENFRPFTNGTYMNLETDLSEQTIREIYPSPTYERIVKLKTEYDPDNVLNLNFNIPPLPRP